jgi:competence protein ComEA
LSLVAARGPARAGGLVALALAAAALAPEPSPVPCAAPREVASAQGRTIEVGCGRLAGAELRGPVRVLFGMRIDPNRADAETLESLPGIGAKRAAALVEARVRAPFCRASDLESVTGIGPRTRQGVESWLSFSATAGCEERVRTAD